MSRLCLARLRPNSRRIPMMKMKMHRSALLLAAGTVLACSCGALAQDSKPAPGQDALKGPKVKEGGVPGESRRFAGGDQKRKDQMGGAIPHPMFVRAVDTLKDEATEGSLRLTEAQEASLDEIETSYKNSMREYRDAHKDELMALREQLPENARRRLDGVLGGGPNRAGGKPGKKDGAPKKADAAMDSDRPMDGDRAMDDKDAAQAMARVRELMEGAPKAEDTHTKMWAVLSAPQKAKVEQVITRLKADAETKRAKAGGKDGAVKGMADLPPRVQERLKNMTPEQREEAIKRYQERQKEEQNKQSGDQAGKKPDKKKNK